MFKNRRKNGNSSGERKSENRILRMLGLDKVFATSPVGLEEKDQENACANPWEEYAHAWEETRNALSEAEYNKAQALLTLQQSKQRFC